MASSILTGGRLGWMSSLPRAGWKKHYSRGRKNLKTWRKKILEGVGWESLDNYSALLGKRCVGWVFYGENSVLVVGVTSGLLLEEVVGESVDSEAAPLSSPHAWRYTIKSYIAKFFSIINDLDKIKVKIEDEDQALLLLYSLSSSYKSFRECIIYGGKSTIKVNEI